MIKRSKSKTKYSGRKRADRVSKKRRLKMEDLEQRQLLAVGIIPNTPNVPQYSGARNVGAVQSFQAFESEGLLESGANDYYTSADPIPLGNMPGQENTIDLSGSLPITAFPNDFLSFNTDIDVFAFDLKAGDILDISVLGSAGTIDVNYSDGSRWFGTDISQSLGFYPADSPLQTVGNAIAAKVVPEDGRYFLTVAPIDTTGNYTIGLRTYRPVVEQLPIGSQQVIFLDFDGGIYPRNIFTDGTGIPQPGVIRIPSLMDSLPILGIEELDEQGLNDLIDLTIAEVERDFAYLGQYGNAGDYDSTGIAGDFGVTILNSRDHADPLLNPLVTRVMVGGTAANAEQPDGLYGRSTTIDVGNFSMDDIVLAVLDQVAADANAVPISPTASVLNAAADLLALTISHEAGHSFGLRHTERNPFPLNRRVSIIDTGVDIAQDLGVGPDGIYGTLDDVRVDFIDDRYEPAEGYIGIARVTDGLANTLVTGTAGGTVSGRIFNDLNRDGSAANDPGLAGVTVFADINGNGVQDGFEASTTSNADGGYELQTRPGSYNTVAIAPINFAPTTPSSVPTTIVLGGSTGGVNFGFNQVDPNITGTVFIDSDGNGFRDPGEPGIEGIYVYADLDGDDNPDLGEPGTNSSGADHPNGVGSYELNFPGPGFYTIRDVVPPGFEQTFPPGDEHLVYFDGVSLTDNYDFGLLPSQDFGDAPDSYGTTVAENGASHGITTGLTLGSVVDREIDGQPNDLANGDDLDNPVDDEEGVRLTSPLGPGASATFDVFVTNTSGASAYLQAFMDFNRDGDFTDSGEQFVTDLLVTSGTVGSLPITVNVPSGVTPGDTYVRFRLSQSTGVGATGFVSSGEVEDHMVTILDEAQVANDDEFTVSRNTLSNQLDVLANDFQTPDNPIAIDSLNTAGTVGEAIIASDRGSVFYTPPNGFIGRDVFSYTVVDQFGNRSTAQVVVNVSFQSNVPIALDDSFQVPENSVNRALNVLDNDVPSIFGGISITSVTAGTSGGQINIVGGGQSLRYTPLPGFNGTEQFTYSIQDGNGSISSATVTVNLLPGSQNDDIVAFAIGIFDPVNINTPITNVQVGDEFLVRVTVDDLRSFASPQGVASAFLDVLYTDELVATLNTDSNPNFNFDISFGPLFSGAGGLQQGDASTPGLIDEVGAVQSVLNPQEHADPVELFTLRMQAVSPGVATFAGDPNKDFDEFDPGYVGPESFETTVLSSDDALTPSELRLGRTELLITPASDNFTSAIDDSFPDGRDSDGNLISNSFPGRNRLDVLANDNLGPTGTIREFGLVTAPSLGNVFIDNNGTPSDLNDDFFSYQANSNANGLDSFTYVIVTDDSIRSTAEVTLALGNQNANSDVAFDFALVNSQGSPISGVSVGQRFGIQVNVEDLRSNPTFVFAGYLDVLYDSGIIQPSDTNPGDDFNFDVVFGPGYSTEAGVGTAARPGIIDEFGTLYESNPAQGPNPGLLATLFFDAVAPGTARVAGSPSDSSPFQDTLLFQEDQPVDRQFIRFDVLNINVSGSGSSIQNFSLPQDVNADGAVSPIDALLVMNEMSRAALRGEGELAEGESVVSSTYYTDVNGDNRTSALDALQVINYLKRTSESNASGESITLNFDAPASASSTDGTDEVFAALDEASAAKVVSAETPASQSSSVTGTVASQDASDDDDDDLLNLLADDVTGLWS